MLPTKKRNNMRFRVRKISFIKKNILSRKTQINQFIISFQCDQICNLINIGHQSQFLRNLTDIACSLIIKHFHVVYLVSAR